MTTAPMNARSASAASLRPGAKSSPRYPASSRNDGWNERERAADLAGRGKGEDFASAAEVGKCDTGRARGLHAYGAGATGGDQEEGPDRSAQQAKGNKHCLSQAVDRKCRYGVAGGCDE